MTHNSDGRTKASTAARVVLPKPIEFPAPEAANFFQFAWGGPDVQMLVGYLYMLPRQTRPGEEVTVEPEITHRIFMSVRGFAMLRHQVEEAANKLKAEGVPLDELNPLSEGK